MLDFPELSVDSQAIYITGNLFSFTTGAFGGSRLWIVNKTSGAVSVYNPSSAAGLSSSAFSLAPAALISVWMQSVGSRRISSYAASTESSKLPAVQKISLAADVAQVHRPGHRLRRAPECNVHSTVE